MLRLPCKRKRTFLFADVAKLADALDLGSSGKPWGFKSLHPHHNNTNTNFISSCFLLLCLLYYIYSFQAQLYSYSYAFIDRNGEITDYNLNLAQDSYTLTYKLNQDSSIYDVEAIVNSNFTIRTITVKMNGPTPIFSFSYIHCFLL